MDVPLVDMEAIRIITKVHSWVEEIVVWVLGWGGKSLVILFLLKKVYFMCMPAEFGVPGICHYYGKSTVHWIVQYQYWGQCFSLKYFQLMVYDVIMLTSALNQLYVSRWWSYGVLSSPSSLSLPSLPSDSHFFLALSPPTFFFIHYPFTPLPPSPPYPFTLFSFALPFMTLRLLALPPSSNLLSLSLTFPSLSSTVSQSALVRRNCMQATATNRL